MSQNSSLEQRKKMLQWFNKNRRQLLECYPDLYVAYNENGIIAYSESLDEVLKIVENLGLQEAYSIYVVPKHNPSVQILAISLSR